MNDADKGFWELFCDPFKNFNWRAFVKTACLMVIPILLVRHFHENDKILWVIPDELFAWLMLGTWSFKVFDGFDK